MNEINLLKSLPKPKRNIFERSNLKSAKVIEISKKFGFEYFDGPREFGYGGYKYDGRWRSVAKDLIDYYQLTQGMKVLDIGCAKGFLVKDLMIECPGLEVFGVDISEYAILNCEPELVGRLNFGNAKKLLFPNNSFDLVLSINTIHNLSRLEAGKALTEIQRISKGKSFVVVDSYYTPAQKKKFESWVLTAEYHDYPEEWIKLFKESGYTGDYYWTVVE